MSTDDTTNQKNLAEARERSMLADTLAIQLEREKRKDNFDLAQDYLNGMLTFCASITEESAQGLTATMRRLERMFPGRAVNINLTSPGGEVVSGFQMIDDILASRKRGIHVTMTVRGQACSMAAVMLQAADLRLIGEHASIMLHRASFGVQGTAAEVEDTLEETKQMEATIYGLLAKRSGKTVGWWKKKLSQRKDCWWTAEQALVDGLVDAIG